MDALTTNLILNFILLHRSPELIQKYCVPSLILFLVFVSVYCRYCLGRRVLSCMMRVINFVFALSQLQGVEWGWPGQREPDDEHSPAS